MDFVASRGRLPDTTELPNVHALTEAFGSIPRAFGVVRQATNHAQWETIRQERTQDLLIYLALERFNGRPRFSVLPPDLQLDVKVFFGTYTRACETAITLTEAEQVDVAAIVGLLEVQGPTLGYPIQLSRLWFSARTYA